MLLPAEVALRLDDWPEQIRFGAAVTGLGAGAYALTVTEALAGDELQHAPLYEFT
jgi:hypothetical protein